jgi:hypothetical protein
MSNKYGITWTNDDESVCQTGYVYDTIEAANDAGVQGLKLGAKLSEGGHKVLGVQIDGMNDENNSQEVTFAIIQTESDDNIHAITLGKQGEVTIVSGGGEEAEVYVPIYNWTPCRSV